jgi:hypothetical protein
MMRSRPEIELKLPSSVRPGDDVRVTMILRSSSETPVERVEVTLTGTESARHPEQSSYSVTRQVHTATAVLSEKTSLGEGTYTFEGSLPLPAEMPFTYIGFVSDVRYTVRGDVEIPWWPDAHETVDLLVSPRPAERPPRHPVSAMTGRGGGPFVEIALDDRAFAPGEEITGAVALGNVRGQRVKGMDVALVGIEHLRLSGGHSSERAVEAHRHPTFLRVDAADEGREIAFRLRVPRDAVPSFDEGLMALVWGVEVRVEIGLASDITHMIPVVIGAFGRPASGADRGLQGSVDRQGAARSGGPGRPRIGSGRWRDAWAEAGAASGLSLEGDELRLTGQLHGCEASIAPEDGGDKHGLVAADLRFPSLDLGLHIGQGGLSLALFRANDELSRRYRVRGRELAQIDAALSPALRGALLAFDSIEMDDEHVRAVARGPSHDGRWVAGLLSQVAELASLVREAASQLPPPSSMAHLQPAFQAFADDLGGQLSVGSMSIHDARFEGGTFSIETRFDEGFGTTSSGGPIPSRTVVVLLLDPPLAKGLDVESSAALAAAPAGARDIVEVIRTFARALRVTEDRIEADMPAPAENPPALREVMRALLALALRLGGDRRGGPYR